MQRKLFFLYGVGAHLFFLAVYAYMAAFVGNFFIPHSIDAPAAGSARMAAVVRATGVNS